MHKPALAITFAAVALIGISLSTAQARCSSNGLRSLNSDVPTTITFFNQSQTYRRIEWIGFDGELKEYGGLNFGESKTIKTFLTHPWIITNGPGDCQQIVKPRAGGSVVRLGGR